MLGYWISVGLAIGGFLHNGYGPVAIVGSTGVLLVWLWLGVRNIRRVSLTARDFFAPIPVLLALGGLSVIPVALNMRSNPDVVADWVRTFLVMLLFGGGMPAALDKARFRPVAAGWWILGVTATALYLGGLPTGLLRGGPLLLGVLLIGSATMSNKARIDIRLLTGVTGLGLLGVAADVFAVDHAMAVAGTHLAILGPIAHGLLGSKRSHPALIWTQHFALIAMVGALAAMTFSRALPWLPLAAWAGALVAVLWVPLGLDAWRDSRTTPAFRAA